MRVRGSSLISASPLAELTAGRDPLAKGYYVVISVDADRVSLRGWVMGATATATARAAAAAAADAGR